MIQQEEKKRSEGKRCRGPVALHAGAAEPDGLIVLDLFTSQSVTVEEELTLPLFLFLRLVYPSQTGRVGMSA